MKLFNYKNLLEQLNIHYGYGKLETCFTILHNEYIINDDFKIPDGSDNNSSTMIKIISDINRELFFGKRHKNINDWEITEILMAMYVLINYNNYSFPMEQIARRSLPFGCMALFSTYNQKPSEKFHSLKRFDGMVVKVLQLAYCNPENMGQKNYEQYVCIFPDGTRETVCGYYLKLFAI